MSDDQQTDPTDSGGAPASAPDPGSTTDPRRVTDRDQDSRPRDRDRDNQDSGPTDQPPPDPFKIAVGGSSRTRGADLGQAYRRSRTVFQSGSQGAVISDGQFGSVHIGNQTTYNFATARRLTPGQVHEDELERVRGPYAPVPGYRRIRDLLAYRRLVLLRGPDGTGRSMTALRLLDDIGQGSVSRLDTGTGVHHLTETDLSEGHGHLADLRIDEVAVLSRLHLDRLSGMLETRGAWLVLIIPHDSVLAAGLADYLADCGRPDRADILERQLLWMLRRHTPETGANLRVLADSTEIDRALGEEPSPAEVANLVALLDEHGRGERSEQDVVTGCLAARERVLADWFDPRPMAVETGRPGGTGATTTVARKAAYRVALAVFHGSPQHVVAEAGESLGRRLIRTQHPFQTPGLPVFAGEHDGWLLDSRAVLSPGTVLIGTAAVQTTLASFDDERRPLEVIKYLWSHHHNVRGPVRDWLHELAADTRPTVWMRAAQAVGVLCGLDFAAVSTTMLDPWADAQDSPDHQINAAFALEEAARIPDVEPAVRATVDQWKESSTESRRRAATETLGREFGLARLDSTLDDLLSLGTWRPREHQEPPLLTVAGRSLANLVGLGGVDKVTTRVRQWVTSRRPELIDLALVATLSIASVKVSELLNPSRLTDGPAGDRWPRLTERGAWPLMLAMATDDPSLFTPFADMVWNAVENARARRSALTLLGKWALGAQRDPAQLTPLARFLRLLGDRPHSRQRLAILLRTMRTRWEHTLDHEVAEWLWAAVAESTDPASLREEAS